MHAEQSVATRILAFYRSLKIGKVPRGVKVMNPYLDARTWDLVCTFYEKYYSDNHPRVLILGINPGRRGGGVTGIPFTDPIKLDTMCGIPSNLPKKAELSADFIYQVIDSFGGAEAFYGRFFLGAVCPLGFTKAGKNMNYYDDRKLQDAVGSFIIRCLQDQAAISGNTEKAYCLGEGKNFAFLSALNNRFQLFKEIIPLPHPRFIMQYRRRTVDDYVRRYVSELSG